MTDFPTKNSISIEIEIIKQRDDISYIEAVIQYCDEKALDIEDVSTRLNQNMRDKIQLEAETRGLMKVVNPRLDI